MALGDMTENDVTCDLLRMLALAGPMPVSGDMEKMIEDTLMTLPGVTGVQVHCGGPPFLSVRDGWRRLDLTGEVDQHGMIDLHINDDAAFAPVEPHLRMTATILARDLDRRVAEVELARRHQELEAQYQRRTEVLAETSRKLGSLTAALKVRTDGNMAFLRNVSHELRTPLNAIRGFSEMLQALESPDSGRRWEYLEAVCLGADRMTAMLDQMLDLARLSVSMSPMEETEFVVRDMARDIFKGLEQEAAQRGIALTITDDAHMRLRGDREALALALTNILGNAIKFSPPSSAVRLVATSEADCVTLAVEDQGPGLPEDVRQWMTGPLEQIPERRHTLQGACLGLPIARAVVGLHGGDLALDRAPGGGAAVRISLPGDRLVVPPAH